MASEEPEIAPDVSVADDEVMQQDLQPAPAAAAPRKRPKLDLSLGLGGERKRGKTMFGLLVGTLNKAKIEDKERNASEAAKKRQLIEQKLQRKLKKETDSMRRAEDAKRDKLGANRKEEELQLQDSIAKLRRRRLPQLTHFLCTSDDIPDSDSSPKPSSNPLTPPPRGHPPPIYWLPAKLLPSQKAFLARRKAEVQDAITEEWTTFKDEREKGIVEISELRQKVIDYNKSKDAEEDRGGERGEAGRDGGASPPKEKDDDASMDIDEESATEKRDAASTPAPPSQETDRKAGSMQADDEDAVEY